MKEIIGVVGAGTMGNGIAQTAAAAGLEVVMCDVSAEFVDAALQTSVRASIGLLRKKR